jgi:predicted transcriptional regulator
MIYVFDTSAFVSLFKSFYRERFPSLWSKFDQMVADTRIVSTREVGREIEEQEDNLKEWMKQNPGVFTTPTSTEGAFVAQIYQALAKAASARPIGVVGSLSPLNEAVSHC